MSKPLTIGVAISAVVLSGVLISALKEQTGQRPEVPQAAQPAVDQFQKACDAYIQLRNKAASGVKPVSKDATPAQLDENQIQTLRAVAAARANAKPGDVFQPAFQEYLRGRLNQVFTGPDGKALRSSILDENPVGTSVRVNGPYPEVLPLTTMPPQVLEVLPKLPKDLEYRFVGGRLILFDSHAHMVIDYIDHVLPGA